MKNFYEYLSESVKEYRYRIKTVAVVTDEIMDRIEKALSKYVILDIAGPKKTIIQDSPLDFRDVQHAEVYIIDVVTHLPASSYVVQQEIRSILNIPEKYIIVRGDNEPIELETKGINASKELARDAQKGGLRQAAILDTTADYEEYETEHKSVDYGDEYNTRLLNYLAQVAADRDELVVNQETRVEKKAPFSWLKTKEVASDFNADHETVKPVSMITKTRGKKAELPAAVANHGNYDDHGKIHSKSFQSDNGKISTKSSKGQTPRTKA